MGLFDKSSSKKSTTNTYTDNRQVNDAGGGIIAGGSVTLSDPGAVRLGEFNAELLGAVAETQTDAIKTIAQFGLDTIRAAGGSVTDMRAQGAQNTVRQATPIDAASAGAGGALPPWAMLAGAAALAFVIFKG